MNRGEISLTRTIRLCMPFNRRIKWGESEKGAQRLFAELHYEHRVDLGQLLGASACKAVQSGVPLPSGFSGCMQT